MNKACLCAGAGTQEASSLSSSIGGQVSGKNDLLRFFSSAARRAFDHDFVVQLIEKAKQPFLGKEGVASIYQVRNFGLFDPQKLSYFPLLQVPFFQDHPYRMPKLDSGEQSFGMVQIQIGKDIPRTIF